MRMLRISWMRESKDVNIGLFNTRTTSAFKKKCKIQQLWNSSNRMNDDEIFDVSADITNKF